MQDVVREMELEENRMMSGRFFGQWTYNEETNYPEEEFSSCLLSTTGTCNILAKLVCKYQGVKCPLI
ncbi:MAG: hypothetical protein QME81_10115 [bacterium]|nr:hypothetical protein [bacterium]